MKVLTILFSLLLITTVLYSNDEESFSVSIYQAGNQITENHNKYQISNSPFEIYIASDQKIAGLHIFGYPEDYFTAKYKLPIPNSETTMFKPGTVVAVSSDETGTPIYISDINSSNYLSEYRNVDNKYIFKVSGISDTYNKTGKNNIATLAIYIDLNKNRIIESNELKIISLDFLDETNHPISKNKAYISTMGFYMQFHKPDEFHKNYALFKISNIEEAKIMVKHLWGKTSSLNFQSIINTDFNKYNIYLITAPINSNDQLNQPYHFTGDSRLIFEITNLTNHKSNGMSARKLTIEKANDTFSYHIEKNGNLIQLKNRLIVLQETI